MKFFERRQKLKRNNILQTQYFICGMRILSRSVPLTRRHLRRNLILCYDSLYDENAEAIDAYTFFLYLQRNRIPSRYVLLRGTRLHRELASRNQLNDIILLDNIDEFFLRCHTAIRRSRVIISAFGLYEHYDNILAGLPYLTYIYAKHGVIFLKELVLNMYPRTRFNRILAATNPESALMTSHGTWTPELQIKSGLPRWDRLHRIPHTTRNIFVFFTWRSSIERHPDVLKIYSDRINRFLTDSKLQKLISENNITINFAMHHAMLKNNAWFKIPDNINLIPADQISSIIGTTDLLITDYSSIVFDFMYLNIPVIFYKFDTDVVYPNPGDNENIALARRKDRELYNCFYSTDDVVRRIYEYIDSDFTLTPYELAINKKFFFPQTNICAELYNQIKDL